MLSARGPRAPSGERATDDRGAAGAAGPPRTAPSTAPPRAAPARGAWPTAPEPRRTARTPARGSMRVMRTAALRPLLVALLSASVVLGTAGQAAAHGGAKVAEGGSGGVSILVNGAETTTASGGAAVDLSTTLQGPGTGDDATVTYWIRPAGGDTFRKTTTRDDAGIAHTDVPTADRGDWRDWDVSAIVRLSDGKRLRVSNAEANPPGPDPASTAGGGATGADDEADTTTGDEPSTGGATGDEPATTDAAPAARGDEPTAGEGDGQIEDVSGEEGSDAPSVAIIAVPVVLILAVWAIVIGRRRAAAKDDDEG